MAIVVKYVVEHKGVEKLVTTDKKEADKYDKMLEVADNLGEYIQAKGIQLEGAVLEDLSIMLSKNKETVIKLMKGGSLDQALEQDKAEVVAMEQKQA